MVENDRMVIVEIGNGQGYQIWESEAKKQGLKYVIKQKAFIPPALENKMVEPAENKGLPPHTEVAPVKPAVIQKRKAK